MCKLQAALKAFRAADSIMHVPTTAIEVAKTEALAGLLLEARDHALTLARSKAQPGEPGPFADARTAAQQLANELDVRIPSVRFTLTGAKEDGCVLVMEPKANWSFILIISSQNSLVTPDSMISLRVRRIISGLRTFSRVSRALSCTA